MIVRHILSGLLLAIMGLTLFSCSDEDTYADLVKRERRQVNAFISKGALVKDTETNDTLLYVPPINVISEETFAAQDSATDLSKNEYVYLNRTGIYMQIIREGAGERMQAGEARTIINRFIEYSIAGDSLSLANVNGASITTPDIMLCTKSSGTFSASFTSGIMYNVYGQKVPAGWLVPLSYINLGRQTSADVGIAKVRLIVPHGQGHNTASTNILPFFYEISYERGR